MKKIHYFDLFNRYYYIILVLYNFFTLLCINKLAEAQESENSKDNSPPPRYSISRIEGRTLYFEPLMKALKAPSPLSNLVGHGVIQNPSANANYAIYSATPCENCTADKLIYIQKINKNERPSQFVYPGKLLDPSSGNLVFEGRAFFGKCLPNRGEIYLVYQKEKVDRRKWLQSSVFIAEPAHDYLKEHLIERKMPKIETTLKRVKSKDCFEISPINRRITTKRMDLTPKRDEEEDEPPPKENQTEKDLPSPQE